MKDALIAAVVAAVVAAASGTAATIVVMSNIKNGTIQMVDLSAKAKRALKGNRGPAAREVCAASGDCRVRQGQPAHRDHKDQPRFFRSGRL
jgi:hypothetical protein